MGTLWNRSGTFERVGDDVPAAGALAYFFLGGTTTPLTVYQDGGESAAHTHPLEADAYGRWPDVFVPYVVSFDVQVTTAEGVQLTYTLAVPNPDPIDLSVTIGAEEKVSTGMIHPELSAATRAGYVRLNGRTIGNAVSGASERANADTEDLFVYLWNLADAIATVSSGRGASGAADYAANKTITLPDCRGVGFIGLDDMGNSAAGLFSDITFAVGDETVAGALLGANGITLSSANLPAHTHTGTTSTAADHTHAVSGTTSLEDTAHSHSTAVDHSSNTGGQSQTHTHSYTIASNTAFQVQAGTGAAVWAGTTSANTGNASVDHTHAIAPSAGPFSSGTESANHAHTFSVTSGAGGTHSHTFTTSATGSGTVVENLGRSRLVTWFIKL